MIKILIVDDEPFVRRMVKSMLDWESMNMQIVAEAFNGKEALEKICNGNLDIQIVITDLRMPVMDGLELIKKASGLKPDVRFIVLSSYDDFHLVKEAFKLGARDYLLKTEMTEHQLHDVLNNLQNQSCASNLSNPDSIVGTDTSTKSTAKDITFLLKENLLAKFISGTIEKEGLKILQQLIRTEHDLQLTLLALEFIPAGLQYLDARFPVINAVKAIVENTASELEFAHDLRLEIVHPSSYEYYLLLFYHSHESDLSISHHLKHIHDCLIQENVFNSTGFSRITPGFNYLPELLNESRLALSACFISGNGSFIKYKPVMHQSTPFYVDSAQKLALLRETLNAILLGNTNIRISALCIDIIRINVCHINAVKDLFLKYYFHITDFSRQYEIYDKLQSFFEQYEKYLKQYGDLHALNKWLNDTITRIMEIKGGNSIIHQVKLYMENHYSEDLSLPEVARIFEFNSSYLSRLFSEKENMSFINYLSKVRITKAIDLMKSSNIKIYEVCEKVGYSNPEHFSRMFKKFTGKSPKQFLDDRGLG